VKDYLQGLALHFHEIIIKAKFQLAILKKDCFTQKPQRYIVMSASLFFGPFKTSAPNTSIWKFQYI